MVQCGLLIRGACYLLFMIYFYSYIMKEFPVLKIVFMGPAFRIYALFHLWWKEILFKKQ